MSFVDLATLALHRRNEMELRISTLTSKCDTAIRDIKKLKSQARSFVERLNCEPAELKDRFLTCMKQLDEYIYLMTDFNLAIANLEENGSVDLAPVQDTSYNTFPVMTPTNLMDVLSEPTPSTSTACPNMCPGEKLKRKRIPKEDQLLIAFSSSSSSAESVPEVKNKVEKEVQCIAAEIEELSVNDPSEDIMTIVNLPAQTMLQTDQVYTAIVMSVDTTNLWVITEGHSEVYSLFKEMTEYYKKHQVKMTKEQISKLTCCVCYDEDSDCYYRALFIRINEEGPTSQVELFLVDTGEMQPVRPEYVHPIAAQFCTEPPYARCCHLADVELIQFENKDMVARQEALMKGFLGKTCSMRVDDNTSESLGVCLLQEGMTITLNDLVVQEGLAVPIGKPLAPTEVAAASTPVVGPPEASLVDSDLDITQCPEFEDPVKAVTGYSNRDEMDICKHYKGGSTKTCFKGSRCKKRHVMKHPDGWTLDRVPVPTKCRPLPLPEPGTWHRVLVTCICHFDRVFVQFVHDEVKEELPSFGVVLPPTTLEGLLRDMNSPAARLAFKQLELAPAPGELVAALYPPDDQWYRARVISSTPADQSVEVFYIDYGNTVWVKEDALRMLDPRFLALPAQAVRCQLAGVVPLSHCSKQWAAAKATLAEMTQDRVLDARVITREMDELTIELFDSRGFSVAEQMGVMGVTAFKDYEVVEDYDNFKVVPA